MNQVVVKQEKSGYQIVEAYKSLRTNLQFCGEDKKVIAVTSCTPNEGKSSVSMQLGISLAESGKRVILIDADLRKHRNLFADWHTSCPVRQLWRMSSVLPM
mgnify:CR=1 FL=1